MAFLLSLPAVLRRHGEKRFHGAGLIPASLPEEPDIPAALRLRQAVIADAGVRREARYENAAHERDPRAGASGEIRRHLLVEFHRRFRLKAAETAERVRPGAGVVFGLQKHKAPFRFPHRPLLHRPPVRQ